MVKTIFGLPKWPFPLYFLLVNAPKVTIQGQHFPVEFRAHPYIFGTSRARRMGAAPQWGGEVWGGLWFKSRVWWIVHGGLPGVARTVSTAGLIKWYHTMVNVNNCLENEWFIETQFVNVIFLWGQSNGCSNFYFFIYLYHSSRNLRVIC